MKELNNGRDEERRSTRVMIAVVGAVLLLGTAITFREELRELFSPDEQVVVSEGPKRIGPGVQLWEGGPFWAECNLGADKPEEFGYYFWWGDTVGYKPTGGTWSAHAMCYRGVTWVSSKGKKLRSSPFQSKTCPTFGRSLKQLIKDGFTTDGGKLYPKFDAATAHLGAPWRMPSEKDFALLNLRCDSKWITRNGVTGQLYTGCGDYASNSIFLPAAGYGYVDYLYYPGVFGYSWSSMTHFSYDGISKYHAFIDKDVGPTYNNHTRCCGRSIRPVRDAGSRLAP